MIFGYNDYKSFLRFYIKSKPHSGRGMLSRLASNMDMTSAQMSHVMQGDRDLNLEQALKCAQYIGLTETETDYFLEMVIYSRAGTRDLKEFTRRKLMGIKSQGLQLKNQVPGHRVLSDLEKSQFYFSWIYSAIRLFCSIKPMQLEEIIDYFNLERSRAKEIINFLVDVGLCINTDKGYVMGQQSTFVPRSSPYVLKHHTNWRLKALDHAEKNLEKDLFFTSPVSLSEKDFDELKVLMTDLIKKFSATVKGSPPECVVCLNIDFFKVEDRVKK